VHSDPILAGPRRRRPGDTPATERWERAAYWPLTAAALVFLIAYTLHETLAVAGYWLTVTLVALAASWLAFVVDYLVRLALCSPRRAWVRSHVWDLLVVLVPAIRPVRLLDAVTRLPSLNRTPGTAIRARLLIYGAGSALLLVWYVSLFVLNAERAAPGATIRSFGNAVWWAFCTVTTVGYGDFVPVTVSGRIAAVILMIGGVVLVGLIVATISSWVAERATRGRRDQRPATRGDVDRVYEAVIRVAPASVRPDER
jgi:voltage-gated potassium channel